MIRLYNMHRINLKINKTQKIHIHFCVLSFVLLIFLNVYPPVLMPSGGSRYSNGATSRRMSCPILKNRPRPVMYLSVTSSH